MKPTKGQVFVEREETQTSKYDIKGADVAFKVTQVNDVDVCKPGDYILFTESNTYKYKGEEIIVVDEMEIVGVDSNA